MIGWVLMMISLLSPLGWKTGNGRVAWVEWQRRNLQYRFEYLELPRRCMLGYSIIEDTITTVAFFTIIASTSCSPSCPKLNFERDCFPSDEILNQWQDCREQNISIYRWISIAISFSIRWIALGREERWRRPSNFDLKCVHGGCMEEYGINHDGLE